MSGGMLSLGILIGVILTLFCVFCVDAMKRDNKIADSELEAWQEWREEWRQKRGER
jgi:hypothetical protein